ncbi:MAG: hypothetical protein QOF70_5936, partial [Acetobacteraceae bacterium]|nr:hypothetical protein [Acetobacteraceae bacterium]
MQTRTRSRDAHSRGAKSSLLDTSILLPAIGQA